jgi:hypothetical protein
MECCLFFAFLTCTTCFQQDGLRVKVLAWGRRPFAEDRLAAEGRFTELFLPALRCCDRPVCPPAGTSPLSSSSLVGWLVASELSSIRILSTRPCV